MIAGYVLDTSGVYDIVTGQTVFGQAFVSATLAAGDVLLVPSTVLLQATAMLEVEHRPLLDLFLDLSSVVVEVLDTAAALAAGGRIQKMDRGELWIVEASIIQAARTRGWRVFTRAPERLWEVDAHVQVVTPPA